MFWLATMQYAIVIAPATFAGVGLTVTGLCSVFATLRSFMVGLQADGAQLPYKDLLVGFVFVNRNSAGSTEVISLTKAAVLLAASWVSTTMVFVTTTFLLVGFLSRLFGITTRSQCCNIGSRNISTSYMGVFLPPFILRLSVRIGIHQLSLSVILSQCGLMFEQPVIKVRKLGFDCENIRLSNLQH